VLDGERWEVAAGADACEQDTADGLGGARHEKAPNKTVFSVRASEFSCRRGFKLFTSTQNPKTF
jgi:hypothetical protein